MIRKKNTFIFNLDWVEILRAYPAEVRYEVYDAIIGYAQSGTLSELKPLAKMAFDFIKKEMDYNDDRYAQISASRSAAGKQGGAPAGNDNAKKQAKTSKTSYNDNDNDNDNVSLSLTPSHEVAREDDGVTAVEKERFFEIFFFRNFQHPDKEVERFVDFYSATGWRRHGDVRVVQDRQALARQWKPENSETGCNRFPSEFLNPFLGCFSAIRAQNESDAIKIIHGVIKVEISADKMRIICNDETRLLLERYIGIVNFENLTGGRALHYAVPRN